MSETTMPQVSGRSWDDEIRRVEQLLFTVEETAQILRVSRTRVFALLRSQELASVRLGGARRIPKDAIQQFVDQLPRDTHSVSA